ncbi:MAG: hypothetical protein JNK75_03995 [Betaproteobacteria bacterium]|nr:hypothetical protein [Betaproteobacteria bacterium]
MPASRDVVPSPVRLHVLRATYAFMLVGLALTQWPVLFSPPGAIKLMNGVVASQLSAVSLLALAGLWFPLRMIPILLFELAWKSIWLIAFALPAGLAAEPMSEAMRESVFACLMGWVIFPVVIPWTYVLSCITSRPHSQDSSTGAPSRPVLP